MRVYLDACIDWRLSRSIEGHEVTPAHKKGWSAIQNGELLALVSKEFDVFVTVDRNLSFQQNLPAFGIAVIVVRAVSNRLADLLPLVPRLTTAIAAAERGIVTYVGD